MMDSKEIFRKLKKPYYIYLVLLSLVAFTIPLPMLLNNIAIILLGVFWLFLGVTKKLKKPGLKMVLILTIPFTILLLGGINTANQDQWLTELTKSLPFLLLPVIIFSVPFGITKRQFENILITFVYGNITTCLVLTFIIVKTVFNQGFNAEMLWLLTHENLSLHVSISAIYLSLFISLALIIMTYFHLEEKRILKTEKTRSYILKLILLGVILVLLSSRTVLLSCALILSIIVFNYYLKRETLTKTIIRFVLAGLLFSVLIFSFNPVLKWRMQSVIDVQDSNFITGKEEGIKMRKRLWTSSVEVISKNWLYGVGSGDIYDELNEVYKQHKYRIQYRHNMNSHNQYLSVLVANGIIGFLMFLFYMLYPLSIYYKRKKWLPFLITTMFLLCYTTESYFYQNKGVVLISFFITLMMGFYFPTIENNEQNNKEVLKSIKH